MMKLSIKIKLFILTGVMGLLLAVLGGISYFVNTQLTTGLDHMTGPLWSASNSASEATNGVNLQLLTVERILKDGAASHQQDLVSARQLTETAYSAILASDMLSAQQVAGIEQSLADFNQAREEVLQANTRYQETNPALETNIAEFRDVLNRVERIASQNILNHEINAQEEEPEVAEDTEPAPETAVSSDQAVDDFAFMNGVGPAVANDTEMVCTAVDEMADDTAPEEDHAHEQASAADNDWEVVNSAGSARLALMSRAYELENFLNNPANITAVNQLETVYGDLEFAVENINSYISGDREIRDGLQSGLTHAEALSKLLEENKTITDESMQFYQQLLDKLQVYRKHAEQLTALGVDMTSYLTEAVNSETATLKSDSESDLLLILATAGFGLLLMLPVYLISKHSIIYPLNKVSEQLWDIAEGEGDLTVRLSTSGDREIANLAKAFNAFTGKLGHTIASLQRAINKLADTTLRITTVGNQTESAVEHQQTQIDRMAGTMAELSANVHRVAEKTGHAHENAQTVDQEARSGKQVVDGTIAIINNLANEVEKASTVINQLGQKSDQISTVLEVIRTISEQTNLLALNAAIEAARAGESGRGFAVVADEVRNLASRTHDSIEEIQSTINELQQGTHQAMKVMSHAREQARQSINPARDAGDALERITGVVEAITSLNAMIADSTREQSDSASEIEQTALHIRDGASATSGSARELSESTADLKALAEELTCLANQFKIDESLDDSSQAAS